MAIFWIEPNSISQTH